MRVFFYYGIKYIYENKNKNEKNIQQPDTHRATCIREIRNN